MISEVILHFGETFQLHRRHNEVTREALKQQTNSTRLIPQPAMTGNHVSSLYVRQRAQSLEEFQVLVLKDWMFLTTLSWKKHVWANVSSSGSSLSQYLVYCSFGIYDTYCQQF